MHQMDSHLSSRTVLPSGISTSISSLSYALILSVLQGYYRKFLQISKENLVSYSVIKNLREGKIFRRVFLSVHRRVGLRVTTHGPVKRFTWGPCPHREPPTPNLFKLGKAASCFLFWIISKHV